MKLQLLHSKELEYYFIDENENIYTTNKDFQSILYNQDVIGDSEWFDSDLYNFDIDKNNIITEGYFVSCPYSQEIQGDFNYNCNCCESYQYQCSMDI